MSTRCTIHFTWADPGPGDRPDPDAIVYRHTDGYPDSMIPALQEFFEAVEAQTKDTRFADPPYLAAKFVVWLAGKFAHKLVAVGDGFEYVPTAPLDFISVGVVTEDPQDIEYRYVVHCNAESFVNNRPVVTVEEL